MSKGLDDQAHANVQGIYLLFKGGARPTASDIARFIKQRPGVSISFDPAAKPRLEIVSSDGKTNLSNRNSKFQNDNWLELLSEGLTFDLLGLGPASAVGLPLIEHSFDFAQGTSGKGDNALNLRPGAHILSASGTVPVLKSLLRLARDLVQHFESIEAVVWPHSESVIGRRFFESTVTAYLEGGAFPALGLIAFRETVDGGLQSHGLEHLIGQELRIEPDLATDKPTATRLAVRLINQLVITGTVKQQEQVVAPDGQIIRLEPSSNGRFIRVWSG